MSYNEYIPSIARLANGIENPKILEIGLDKGQFCLPMYQNLIITGKPFELHEVDILVREEVKLTAQWFARANGQYLKIFQQNSLDYLKQCKDVYDIVMIDGDHNYYTVLNELELIRANNSHDNTLIFCDDATTKWSNRDLFYATRDEYKENTLATPPQTTDKQGVGNAVIDFLEKYPEWNQFEFINNGSIILSKQKLIQGNV